MKKIIDIRVLIPNLITLSAICAGMSAIRFSFEGNFNVAMVAILVAAILDGIDGRIARALKATTQFGAELDSLADVINFGVVPAIILYIWDLKNLGSFGWLACLLYVIAIVLRLARFNVMDLKASDIFSPSETTLPSPLNPRAYFIGVPAPLAAILVLLPIYCSLVSGGIEVHKIVYNLEAIYMIVIAGFTISTLKTFSLKAIRFNPQSSLMVVFGIGLMAALLFSYTWLGLIFLCLCYLCYLFWSSFRALLKYYKGKNNNGLLS